MGIIRPSYKMLVALILMTSHPALAAESAGPFQFIGLYQFDWNGIALGSLELGIEQTDTAYNAHLLITSEGIVNLFTRHSSDTVVNGKIKDDTYKPFFYESRYKTKNKPRHIKLTFNAKGVITEEIVEPPEDPTDRPVVPHSLKDGTYDPLSGMLAILAGQTQLRVYDAKRLYDVKLTAQPMETLRLLVGKRKAQTFTMSHTPVAGLTGKEQKDYDKGEPALTFYMSTDNHPVPLGISVPIYFGLVQGMLWKECATWQQCNP